MTQKSKTNWPVVPAWSADLVNIISRKPLKFTVPICRLPAGKRLIFFTACSPSQQSTQTPTIEEPTQKPAETLPTSPANAETAFAQSGGEDLAYTAPDDGHTAGGDARREEAEAGFRGTGV